MLSFRSQVPSHGKFIQPAKRRQGGFTIIELLVSIALILILISIMLPALRTARSTATQSVCQKNQGTIGVAYIAYSMDHSKTHRGSNFGRWWPKGQEGPDKPFLAWDHPEAYWGVAYLEYLDGNPEPFHCPDTQWVHDWGDNNQAPFYYSTYGLNAWMSAQSRHTILFPSQRIIAHDSPEQHIEVGKGGGGAYDGDGYAIVPGHGVNLWQWRYGPAVGLVPNGVDEFFRHNGKGNILWFDGHVSSLAETTGEDVPLSWYDGVKR